MFRILTDTSAVSQPVYTVQECVHCSSDHHGVIDMHEEGNSRLEKKSERNAVPGLPPARSPSPTHM